MCIGSMSGVESTWYCIRLLLSVVLRLLINLFIYRELNVVVVVVVVVVSETVTVCMHECFAFKYFTSI